MIAGFRLPKHKAAAGFSFKVLFDVDAPTVFEEGIAYSIPDDATTTPLSGSNTNPLVVNSILAESTVLDALSSYTFYVAMNSTLLTPETEFQVDFPSIWQIANVTITLYL